MDELFERRTRLVQSIAHDHVHFAVAALANVKAGMSPHSFLIAVCAAGFDAGLDAGVRAAMIDPGVAERIRDGGLPGRNGTTGDAEIDRILDAVEGPDRGRLTDQANAVALEFLDIYREG